MIKVTVELISAIHHSRNKILGVMEIANDGVQNNLTQANLASYDSVILRRNSKTHAWRRGRIENFPKKRLGCWDLIYRMLKEMVGVRNGEKIKINRNEMLDELKLTTKFYEV